MKISLKRFGVWVTGLRSKYRYDPFFRTETNVILLQIVFAFSLLIFVAIGFNYLYQDVASALVSGIRHSVATGGGLNGKQILDTASSVRTHNLLAIIAFSIVITFAFAYFIARVTLAPTRNALSSQKRFISDIAHELRTPLSVIKTNCEVALLDAGLDRDVRKTLKSNIEELDRTSEIINNLLSFSNWVRPERVSFGNVNLGPVVDAAVKKLQALADKKNITITIKKKEPHTVWGNATALEQISINLLKNAIGYTPANGKITISLEPDYLGNVLLVVTDTGVGIAQKDLFHIFEPFYRAERSRNRQSGSSGLGLTIVSELIKIHRGKITVKSEVNKGTSVTVLIPFSKDSAPLPQKRDADDEISVDFLGRTS